SETFTNEVIASIRNQRMEEFREKYRGVDLLMIDDIQFIAGKESTQEEFFHTFNALHQSGKQIIISSDKPPKAISNLVERLRSRFEGGLIADVQLPDYEMRTAILSARAEELGRALPPDVVEFVAQRDQSNIRELEGALNRILAYAAMTGKPITLETAIEAISENGRTARRDTAGASDIVEVVSGHFRVAVSDLQGRSRSREIVVPRQIAMYLLRELTKLSLEEIGAALGNRDHTTVMHGIEKITRELESDSTLRTHVLQLRESLLTD
ncbi:MAG: chromosomal replication initiator protein DnaA, partial [Chloroflexota bacterium]|nr:chromosomal replication initiator protein DnaA [Chloroflexota bacterium]